MAFVSPCSGAGGVELPQSFAAKSLPNHMIPRHVFSRKLEEPNPRSRPEQTRSRRRRDGLLDGFVSVCCQDWPRSPTGKLDRTRLACQAKDLLAGSEAGRCDTICPSCRHAAWVLSEVQEQVAQDLPPELCTAGAKCFLTLLRKVLRLQHVELAKPLTQLGGDSISAIRLSAGLRQEGYELSPARLLTGTSIEALARIIEQSKSSIADRHSSAKIEGNVPLSSTQKRFFDLNLRNPHHYNQSMMLISHQAIDAACLKRCLVRLAEHHDQLRASRLPLS